ncbi:MAG TPA: uroporphyrinogen-III synthase [Gordonia sp. (in: high G+C Gram-positive bacteria)]|uniref:uroporphyrinogen-III synthase n=1 Tax=unclassified Gordonia (in: high G+C Gram-positive bacteria) TaxID=2657482 RepID=UPI000FB94279|nr:MULTISPECIES: uroporphyrinogen-III synthase [unclassified Gordonia (in: high G+C Gram-positive bacteria)]RUP37880.1 MAG: uroporphyrinogen-III synthase [Gordonia sp. (in: high G+C Gram-positive bacteria)]HNP57499.1 uroporphyrinogen-III synthase [Gordonia sp. (in: high G+C Gram-positive bacteria)]HRC52723.1 uroporphyrinogen-III synthase [Gordonia sp. (in: high G+C Gram-positive bacteria)]
MIANATTRSEGLTGFTVAITAARRADEFAMLLQRRGAHTLSAPAMAIIPLADDVALRAATDDLIATAPDLLIATTGIGFRGWVEATEEWGLTPALMDQLATTRVISRGPKATGALRAAGLREEWSPESESSVEVLAHLPEDLSGQRVAVQLHGATDDWDPNPGFLAELHRRGADVVGVPVYRWTGPADQDRFDQLLAEIAAVRVDAAAFTSAPAVAAMLERAKEVGSYDNLIAALRGPVVPYCVGPVTARPLDDVGVPSVAPERMRLGALARLIGDDLPARRPDLAVAGHSVGVRANSIVVDGEVRDVSPSGMALMHALAANPGEVVSREQLLRLLPVAGADAHAVEVAIGRLRSALGARELIVTVVKRGYRLAVD